MKSANLFGIALLSFSILCCVSCNDDKSPLIQPSADSIAVEGEGGEFEIALANGEWSIAGVKNQDGGGFMFGNVFSPDEKLIRENDLLELEGLGRIETVWSDRGFRIIRNAPTFLKVFVEENSRGSDFNFAIVLQSGQELKEITVSQKMSEGYRFEKIEYAIKDGDKDSLYTRQDVSFRFNIGAPMDFTVTPFYGIKNQSYFQSDVHDAFVWLEKDSFMVEVPSDVYNGKIYLNGEKSLYCRNTTSKPCKLDITGVVSVPAGKSEYSTEIQYRRRIISYTITLINNRTESKKVIEGKWIEIAPTGQYTVTKVNS